MRRLAGGQPDKGTILTSVPVPVRGAHEAQEFQSGFWKVLSGPRSGWFPSCARIGALSAPSLKALAWFPDNEPTGPTGDEDDEDDDEYDEAWLSRLCHRSAMTPTPSN